MQIVLILILSAFVTAIAVIEAYYRGWNSGFNDHIDICNRYHKSSFDGLFPPPNRNSLFDQNNYTEDTMRGNKRDVDFGP